MKTPCVIPGCSLISKLFRSKSNDFENEALEIHNEYRREHGVPPLVLNKDICKISQKWAEELAKNDKMAYSVNQTYGESVYCGWSPDSNTKIKAKDCVDRWYNEINDFSFGKEPDVLNCGHFTQIVWRSTKELGIGNAKSKSGKLYVVANYYPPGNYAGQFMKNIPPPGAFQFRSSSSYSSSISPRESNNNLAPHSPNKSGPPSPNFRSSKNLSDIANDLVTKIKSFSISTEKFEEEFLQAHNDYRFKHRVPPLELSKRLCKNAEDWAKTISKKGKVEHQDQNEYGENIFYAWSSDPNFSLSGRDPVDKWYSEISNHSFGQEPDHLSSGHFTQVVWEDSREIGVGVAKTKEGQIYVVANYYPPGNVMGSFANNVRPPVY
ncbi:peptidase inhibitor 16-like isoform X1 [Vanessa tameamea]|uniref:Peptidase inhibitor 16-like isoform X1 n=1 Tax=Vanessa tameamea TaxID=334116 RepID=A0A8B8HIR4_VANTA|nr:peptidase inhibitor 16-like isoform X1 [Vanessa tameamea]